MSDLDPSIPEVLQEPDKPPHAALTDDVERRTWEEFRSTGLMWAINTILHWFGWCIVVSFNAKTGNFVEAYPARTKWRGFTSDINNRRVCDLTQWMRESANALHEDVSNESDAK